MRIAKVSSAGAPGRRRGVMAVEVLLVLPLLLIVLLGTAEFALLLIARAELVSASREGARVASHGGGDRDEIKKEVQHTVRRVLGDGRLGCLARAEVSWHDHDPKHPRDGRDRVEVVVHAPAGGVVPNFLGWAGFSIASRELSAGVTMNVE
jgi:hypothetical protein